MLVAPVVMPKTTPVMLFTEATAVLPEVQVPPVTVLVRVMVLPVHTVVGPLMVPAVAVVFTVTVAVAVSLPQAAEVAM
jgi:hypothetical protein